MKYIYLCIFLSILINSSFCENTSFLKTSNENDAIPNVPETPEPKSYTGICFMKMKNQFYDFTSFNTIKPWKITTIKGKQVKFNFCSNIDTKCSEDDVLMADQTICKKFAGKADKEKTWTLEIDKKTKRTTVSLKFPPGDSCGGGKYFQTTVRLTCDPKATVPRITNDKTFDPKKCNNVINISSKSGNNNLNYFILNLIIFIPILKVFSLHYWKIQCLVESVP